MKETLILRRIQGEQDRRIIEAVEREQARLRNFIRRHVADREDAEDILQEVFYEFVEAYRLLKPVERVSGWLFRVARNRIIDLFRKRKPGSLNDPAALDDDGQALVLEDLDSAIDELPQEQREIFIAHEIEGRSFKELAVETGVGVNTLLSRKRYA